MKGEKADNGYAQRCNGLAGAGIVIIGVDVQAFFSFFAKVKIKNPATDTGAG